MKFREIYKTYNKKCINCDSELEFTIGRPGIISSTVTVGAAANPKVAVRRNNNEDIISISVYCGNCEITNIFEGLVK